MSNQRRTLTCNTYFFKKFNIESTYALIIQEFAGYYFVQVYHDLICNSFVHNCNFFPLYDCVLLLSSNLSQLLVEGGSSTGEGTFTHC